MNVRTVILCAAAALLLAGSARADLLDDVKRSGVLRWGCDAQGGAPYVYKDPHALNRYVGFEVEIADALGRALGVRAVRVQNQWPALIAGLERSDYDVAMNGLEITPVREKEALFSRPYYVSTLDVTVLRKDAPAPGSLEALRGRGVGALKESLAERLLKDEGGIVVRSYDDPIASYLDLRHGNVGVVVMDAPIAMFYARRDDLASTHAGFGEARYGIAARKGQVRLVAAIDAAIEAMIRDGSLRQIYQRYGVYNAATATLFGDSAAIVGGGLAPMQADFERPGTLRDRLANYRDSLGLFGLGALTTLGLSVAGMAMAVALGLILALVRLYGPGPLRTLAAVYIEGIRGTPLLIQLYIIFYGLPDLGVNLPPFPAAVLGLGLNYAAYEAENYRAGLMSIAIGQTEAAHALGLTHMQTLRYVIVPQALRLVIPPVTNDFIALLKDSSVVSVIAMTELTETYQELRSATGDPIGMGLVAAAFYFLLGWPFAKLAAWLEARARRGRR